MYSPQLVCLVVTPAPMVIIHAAAFCRTCPVTNVISSHQIEIEIEMCP